MFQQQAVRVRAELVPQSGQRANFGYLRILL